MGAVEDVALGGFVVALAHEFFLNEVLNVLDVDKGMALAAHAVGHSGGDGGGRFWVGLDGEEGFAAGDFDFYGIPGHDAAIAADEADVGGFRGGFLGDFEGAIAGRAGEDEAFGHIVGVIFDEGFFDEEGEVVLREAEAASVANLFEEHGCD